MNTIFKGKRLILAIVLSLVSARLGATPWSLVSCDSSGEAKWRAFEHAMRTAKPRSPVYAPFPFPTSDDQVVRDYLDQYWSLVKGLAPSNRQPHERRVMAALSAGKVTFQVMRVENWTVTRCREEQKRDFLYLVRVFDRGAAGVELSRAVLNDSGLLVTWNNMPANAPGPVASQSRSLRPAATVIAEVNSALGLGVEDPQYVVTFGTPPLSCVFTHPCLAFRRGGLSYLMAGDEIFEVSAGGPQLKLGREVGSPAQESVLNGLGPDEKLISLGGKAFTIAHLVSASDVREGRSVFHHPRER